MYYNESYLSGISFCSAGYPIEIKDNGWIFSGKSKIQRNSFFLSSLGWTPNQTAPKPKQ